MLMRYTSVGEENEAFFIRVWKPLPSIRVLKTLRGNPKRIISASGVLGLIQMLSELDTRRCASEDAGLEGRWIVRSHICWGGERNIFYKDVEISP